MKNQPSAHVGHSALSAANASAAPLASEPVAPSNFIRNIIDADLAAGRTQSVVTRFPPEPNGYLHFGHAKSICLNFGLARDYKGRCHLRLDDTNPTKEDQEYVDAIEAAVRWLGFDWGKHHYFASDYFQTLYDFAESLIQHGFAYVDSQSADDIRANRGTLTTRGKDSPFRNRTPDENLSLFRDMRAGKYPDGSHVLRAKIDMGSPNMNMRDPVLYRIRHAAHHRTGNQWCIYPLYDYAHPLSDAIEGITHSICTLEFEDHRPLYDWLLEKVAACGKLDPKALPHQYEFARLNLTYVVLSKRKLVDLIESNAVEGWDDPRMPTLVAARRRGYTAEGFRRFAEMIGVAKSDGWIDYSVLEECMRDHLNDTAHRRVAVLDPLKLVIENFPEDAQEDCFAPNHPQQPDLGKRAMPFTRELWIEREDFQETPAKGFFRLAPGAQVRLRYAFVIECTGFEKNAAGEITLVRAKLFEDSKSGTAGADTYKVKGNLHWVSAKHAYHGQVRLYDRLFAHPTPGARREGDAPDAQRNFLEDLNEQSLTSIQAAMEPSLKDAKPEDRFQFERHGYFVADLKDSAPGLPVFNRTVTLKDSWK
jgi:glutaminyl-tRNA synthetase